MKKTNFKAEYDDKTGKYNLIRFNGVYGSYTEQELHKKGFTIKNNKLYEQENRTK
jgi:hypothetical protein